jgi:hypothetical protein
VGFSTARSATRIVPVKLPGPGLQSQRREICQSWESPKVPNYTEGDTGASTPTLIPPTGEVVGVTQAMPDITQPELDAIQVHGSSENNNDMGRLYVLRQLLQPKVRPVLKRAADVIR